MKKRFLAMLLSLVMLIGLMPVSAEGGTTLYVDNTYSAEDSDGTESKPYTTIAKALEAVTDADSTIIKVVGTGTEYDAFKIEDSKDGIIIEGADSNNKPVIKTCYEDSPTWEGQGCGGIDFHAENVVLRNLKIVNYGHANYWYAASIGYNHETTGVSRDNLKVEGCDFVGQGSGNAIISHNENFTLTGSTFEGFETVYSSMCDGGSVTSVTITGNTFKNIEYPVNVYYGAALTEGAQGITITNNTISNDDDDATSKILIWDYAQANSGTSPAIKATITGNNGDPEIELTHVNMTATNEIVLDEAAAESTTVYHKVTVNDTSKGYESVTVTGSDGRTYPVGEDGTASLPVSHEMTFGEATVPAAAPVTITYTTSGGASTTVEAAVKAADPTDSSPAATLKGVDEQGNVTEDEPTVPDASSVKAVRVGEQEYSSWDEAVEAIKDNSITSPTIEILSDLTIETWNQVWDTNNWTINGGNHKITVGKLESNMNGDFLFFRANNLNVSDLTVEFLTNGNGFDMHSGKLDNVHLIGGSGSVTGVFVGNGGTVEITNSTVDGFSTYGVVGNDGANASDIVIKNTEISDSSVGVLSYAEKTVLEDNKISNVGEVSLAAAYNTNNTAENITYTITGNTFEDVTRIDLHKADLNKVTFEQNKVDKDSQINATEGSTGVLNVNNNYWGSADGPSDSQVNVSGDAEVTKDVYYEAPGMQESDKNTYEPPVEDKPSSGSNAPKYDITVDKVKNGEVSLSRKKAAKGTTITLTVTPDEGYEIDRVIVRDEDGEKLKLTEKGDGKYTFKMPKGDVEIEVRFVELEDGTLAKQIILTLGSPVAIVDGKEVVNDVAPVARNWRTMLPIRFVAEALGATVEWDADNQRVTITKGDLVIEIYIGSDVAYVNGQPVQLDSPAFAENNRTYLPLRFVAENLGALVEWDQATQTVTITAK